jgi:hypothetical protein
MDICLLGRITAVVAKDTAEAFRPDHRSDRCGLSRYRHQKIDHKLPFAAAADTGGNRFGGLVKDTNCFIQTGTNINKPRD